MWRTVHDWRLMGSPQQTIPSAWIRTGRSRGSPLRQLFGGWQQSTCHFPKLRSPLSITRPRFPGTRLVLILFKLRAWLDNRYPSRWNYDEPYLAGSPLSVRRPRALYRRGDHGDPSWKAPRGVRHKLSAALDKYPELFEPSIEELMLNLPSIPEDIRTDVHNHGGGHANHSFFWPLLGKGKGGQPVGDLKKAIAKSFGSFENFKEQFHAVSLKHFRSRAISILRSPAVQRPPRSASPGTARGPSPPPWDRCPPGRW